MGRWEDLLLCLERGGMVVDNVIISLFSLSQCSLFTPFFVCVRAPLGRGLYGQGLGGPRGGARGERWRLLPGLRATR